MLLLVRVLLLLAPFIIVDTLNIAGKYECVEIQDTRPCEHVMGKDMTYNFDVRIRKSKEGRRVSGQWYLTEPMDEKMSHNLTFWKWGKNGYRYVMHNEGNNSCNNLKEKLPQMYEVGCDAVHRDFCPIPAGNHTVYNFPLCQKARRFPVLPYGKFRVDVQLFLGEVEAGCHSFFVEVKQ